MGCIGTDDQEFGVFGVRRDGTSNLEWSIRIYSTTFLALLLELVGVGVLVSIIIADDDLINGRGDKLFGGSVFCLGMWLLWQLSVAPSVFFGENQLIIRNPFSRWVVEYDDVESIEFDEGTVVLATRSGRKVEPFILKPSLIVAVTGFRKQQIFIDGVEAAARASKPRAVNAASVNRAPIFLGLLLLEFFWAVVFLVAG